MNRKELVMGGASAMKAKRKLKNKSGFTLAETLLAVLILLLVSTIVATGMPAAKNAYNKVIVAANAQVALSTAATALRDELGTAWNVKIEDVAGKERGLFVTYSSSDTGAISKIYLNTGDNKIYLQEYLKNTYFNEEENVSIGTGHPLVSDKAANGNLVITYSTVAKSRDGKSIIVSGLVVKKDDQELAKLNGDLTIPVLSFAPDSAS